MNKKFSTLVAALMAAGALVMPADMFAQLRYVGGKAYTGENPVGAITKLPTKVDEPTQQFIVFQDADGKDYIAVVQKGNKLAAVALDKAKMSQAVTINYVSKGTYTVTNGKQILGFSSTSNDWGTDITELPIKLASTSITIGGDALANDAGRYVKLDGKTISVRNKYGEGTFKAKAISIDALEEVVADQADVVSAETKLDAGYFLLMDNGNVLTGKEDGTAEWTKNTNSNSYWKIEITSNGATTGVAKFVNKGTGEYLTNAAGEQIIVAVTRTAEDKPYQFLDNESIAFTEAPAGDGVVNGIALGVIAEHSLSSSELKTIFGSTFGATIKKGNDAVANNPFTGNLKPVYLDRSTGKVSELTYSTSSFMLQNGDGDIIVMKMKDKYADAKGNTYGYKLDAIAPRDLARALSDTKTAGDYAAYFTFKATEDFNVGVEKVINRIIVADENGNTYCLGSLNVSGKPTLSAENNALQYLDAISIELGLFNTVDVEKLLGTTPGFFTVTNKNTDKKSYNYGKVLGVTTYGQAGYVDPEEALVGYPETQWAVTYDDENKELVFKNRENPERVVSNYEDLDGDGEYTDPVYFSLKTTELYNIPGKTNVYAYQGDTIEIKINTDYKESDGYVRYNNAEYEDQHYYVGVYSPVWNGSAWMVENHNNSHKVGLDTDKENATEWELTPAMEIKRDFDGKILSVTPDTVEIKSILGYYKDGNYTTTVDDNGEGTVILKFPAYALKNTDNGEYMAYYPYGNNQYYATGSEDAKEGYTNIDNADFFAIRIIGENQYNLATVQTQHVWDNNSYVLDEENPLVGLALTKVYGGDSADKGILNSTYLYNQEENDVITIEAKEAPEYRKVAMGDTISIYRNEDPANVLFEKGEFLGIPTSLQLPDANPALFVDTAYVNRGNNNRWEYLLAVDAKHWESNLECEIPDHPKHHADTTTGRFLVNLMDSAYVYHDNNIHDNKFINEEDGEYYAKLGFVEGYHTHDTLYLKRPNGTYDAISMTREDYGFSIAKFAFRYVDNEDESFVIETGCKDFWASDEYRDNVSRGYLKWMNGVVVVVDDIDNADIFNMNEDETRTPTANEEISANAAVSVVATDGAVIVKGAEGKSVVVSTILGKVVANEVLNSDNETIAAPAGIVVVSVDGESFKVAVK